MENIIKTKSAFVISMLFVALIAGTVIFFSEVLNNKNSKIDSLNNEITDLNNEIANQTSQISSLKGQIIILTSANLETALGVTDVPYDSSHNMPSPLLYNHLFITGSVNNTGKGIAYNAGLNVVAYAANGTLEINMTVSLVGNSATFGTDAATAIYGNDSLHLGNLFSTQSADIALGIFHKGAVSNWTVTPVWTNSP
jgi:hypothetical protein